MGQRIDRIPVHLVDALPGHAQARRDGREGLWGTAVQPEMRDHHLALGYGQLRYQLTKHATHPHLVEPVGRVALMDGHHGDGHSIRRPGPRLLAGYCRPHRAGDGRHGVAAEAGAPRGIIAAQGTPESDASFMHRIQVGERT